MPNTLIIYQDNYRYRVNFVVHYRDIGFTIIAQPYIQGNSIGVLSSGLLAELPTILDSFFTNTTSDFIGVVGRGW